MMLHIDKIINSAGIICDLIGAWLVAWEVVKQFRGNKLISIPLPRIPGVSPVAENPKFKNYEKIKYCRMKVGLIFLTIGFILQIISNWIICILDYFKG